MPLLTLPPCRLRDSDASNVIVAGAAFTQTRTSSSSGEDACLPAGAAGERDWLFTSSESSASSNTTEPASAAHDRPEGWTDSDGSEDSDADSLGGSDGSGEGGSAAAAPTFWVASARSRGRRRFPSCPDVPTLPADGPILGAGRLDGGRLARPSGMLLLRGSGSEGSIVLPRLGDSDAPPAAGPEGPAGGSDAARGDAGALLRAGRRGSPAALLRMQSQIFRL